MNLNHFLLQKKPVILERWLKLIMADYPADSSGFFKKEKDRFINPVGYNISHGTEMMFDELLQGMKTEEIASSLEDILKILSIQNFSPSQAVSFIFYLKRVVREEVSSDTQEEGFFKELSDLESRIDRLILDAFDVFMKCREKVYEVRMSEVKAEKERMHRLLECLNPVPKENKRERNYIDRNKS